MFKSSFESVSNPIQLMAEVKRFQPDTWWAHWWVLQFFADISYFLDFTQGKLWLKIDETDPCTLPPASDHPSHGGTFQTKLDSTVSKFTQFHFSFQTNNSHSWNQCSGCDSSHRWDRGETWAKIRMWITLLARNRASRTRTDWQVTSKLLNWF